MFNIEGDDGILFEKLLIVICSHKLGKARTKKKHETHRVGIYYQNSHQKAGAAAASCCCFFAATQSIPFCATYATLREALFI